MSKTYIVKYEDKFNITGRGDVITVKWKANDCEHIQKGDTVIVEGEGEYEVRGVEMSRKSFGIIGENIGILIKRKQYIGLIHDERDENFTVGYNICSELNKMLKWKEEMLGCNNIEDCKVFELKEKL